MLRSPHSSPSFTAPSPFSTELETLVEDSEADEPWEACREDRASRCSPLISSKEQNTELSGRLQPKQMSKSRHNDTGERRPQESSHPSVCLQAPAALCLLKRPKPNFPVTNCLGYRELHLAKHRTLIIPTCYSLLMSTFNNAHRSGDKGGWKVSFSRASRLKKRLRGTRGA